MFYIIIENFEKINENIFNFFYPVNKIHCFFEWFFVKISTTNGKMGRENENN